MFVLESYLLIHQFICDKMKCVPLLLLLGSSCLCPPLKDSHLNVETCSGLRTFMDSLEYDFAVHVGDVCKDSKEAKPRGECLIGI